MGRALHYFKKIPTQLSLGAENTVIKNGWKSGEFWPGWFAVPLSKNAANELGNSQKKKTVKRIRHTQLINCAKRSTNIMSLTQMYSLHFLKVSLCTFCYIFKKCIHKLK